MASIALTGLGAAIFYHTMKDETIFNNHTDIISDWLFITCWAFDIKGLKETSGSGDYTEPVRIALLRSLGEIANSRNKRIRERSFTIFMGDFGEGNQNFGIGIRDSTYRKVKNIFLKEFEATNGFLYETNDRMPFAPFVPCYRYIHGNVIEYTFEDSLVGKKYVDSNYGSGLTIKYREWVSAENYGLKQRYIKKG